MSKFLKQLKQQIEELKQKSVISEEILAMNALQKAKILALEMVVLIDNANKENHQTYKKIGNIIEELQYLRLDIIKTPYIKKGEDEK